MTISKTKFLPLAILLCAGVYVAVLWDRHFFNADVKTCAVYQGLFAELPEKEAIFFEGVSQPYEYFPSEYLPEAPKEFSRDTEEFQEVEALAAGIEPFTVAVREYFEHDTADYFSAVATGKKERIKDCFKALDNAPGIYSGPYNLLHAREKMLGRDDQGFVTHWRVSPVGFSEDGRFAVIYADSYCGGLCGWGGIILFEIIDGKWSVIGDKTMWVS